MKIGHAHLKVRDLDRAIDFYTRFLDLRITERLGNQYAFLTGGGFHHEIALQRLGPGASTPGPHHVGLYHVAFEAAGRSELVEIYRRLLAGGIEVRPVDHLISWAVYFSDPDGNGLEVYWDTRRETFGRPLWHGENVPLPESKLLGKEMA